MQRIRRTMEERPLDLAPLIDVVFLLLTFFVFSLAMAVQLRITDIRLPTGTEGGTSIERSSSLITLDGDGTLEIDGATVSFDELADRLTALRADQAELTIFVATDERASARDLFRLMDAFAAASITDLRFLREDTPPRDEP